MTSSWIDLALLASMQCMSDVLLPHFSAESKMLVRQSSRTCIDQLAAGVGLERLLRRGPADISKRTMTGQLRTLKSGIASQGPLAERIISRYVERMEAGFSSGHQAQLAEIELISATLDRITRLEIDQATHNEILELALALPPCEPDHIDRLGLASALVGSLSGAESQWDQKLVSIVDHEYDLPYIESIAMRLKARFPGADLLNVWRSTVPPDGYEKLRGYILCQCQIYAGGAVHKTSFEELILPY